VLVSNVQICLCFFRVNYFNTLRFIVGNVVSFLSYLYLYLLNLYLTKYMKLMKL